MVLSAYYFVSPSTFPDNVLVVASLSVATTLIIVGGS